MNPSTTTSTLTRDDALHSTYLSTSLSSLSSSRSTNSLIVRTYKQATQLYLTKRFKEALDTLEPIISPQSPPTENGDAPAPEIDGSAPVAQSSKSTRTKVWVFYLSLLHAIVELGAEEGKHAFGSGRWRTLAALARSGSVWDDVVRHGYGGNAGDVDGDVVVNLATLLLGHMPAQTLTQLRLETYLSASVEGSFAGGLAQEGMATPMSNSSASPKAFATRLKVLELYALHVLPANGEWDYAREFIEMNDLLDEERKEAFLQALEGVKEEQDGTARRERELKEQREREMEEQRRREEEEEARRVETARKDEEERKRVALEAQKARSKPPPNTPATASSKQPRQTASSARIPAHSQKKPAPSTPTPPRSLYHRASSVLSTFQQTILHASRNMPFASMPLLRLLMFLAAFLLLIARRDLRMKVRRTLESGWVKVRQTVGMGVKVSYI